MKKFFAIFAVVFAASWVGLGAVEESVFGTAPSMNRREADAVKEAQEAKTPAEAEAELLEASKKSWAGSAVFFNLANLQYNAGKIDDAVKSYKTAIEKTPKFFMAQRNLGFALSSAGREDEAFGELVKALALSGGSDSEILDWLTAYHIRRKDYSSALAACNQSILYAPQKRDCRRAKAMILYELGDYAESERLCCELLSENAADRDILAVLAKSRISLKDWAGAMSALEIMRALKLADARVLELYGDVLCKNGLYADAAKIYAESKSDSGVSRAAWALANSGEYQKALAACSKSSAADVAKVRAAALAGLGRYAEAAAQLRAYVDSFPDDSSAVLMLGRALADMADWQAAKICFERAEADPELGLSALYGRLRVCVALNEKAEALDAARKISQISPRAELAAYIKYLEGQPDAVEKFSR